MVTRLKNEPVFTLTLCYPFSPQAYVKKVETQDMLEIEQKLVEAKDRLSFLVDYANFSPVDMRLNSSTFQWFMRLPEVFEEHRQIIKEKTDQYQDGLKVRIAIGAEGRGEGELLIRAEFLEKNTFQSHGFVYGV